MASQAELSKLVGEVETALAHVRALKLDHLEFLLSMALTEAKRQSPTHAANQRSVRSSA